MLTDKGKEFTDRFDNDIEHRLTKPRHPQTNGMVERFNGRRGGWIEEVLKQTRFAHSKELATTIEHYAKLYDARISQNMVGHRTPLDALRKWQRGCPELFVKKNYNLAGSDIPLVSSGYLCVILRSFGTNMPSDVVLEKQASILR